MQGIENFRTSPSPIADNVIWRYLKAAISTVLSECQELPVEAILLDGSLCAGDGVMWFIDGQKYMMSDIDLLVVSRGNPAANAAAQQRVNRKIAQILPEVVVDVWIGTQAQLESAIQPRIAKINFMRNFKVLWGAADWLKVVGVPNPSDIPRHDLVLLVMNRIMEQLWILLLYLEKRAMVWDVLYHSVKAVLDMALVQLVMVGQYEYVISQRFARFVKLIEEEHASKITSIWSDAKLDVEDAMQLRSNPNLLFDSCAKNSADCFKEVIQWWFKAAKALIANVCLVCVDNLEDSTCHDALRLAEDYFTVGKRKTIKEFRRRMIAWRKFSASLYKRMIPGPSKLQCARLALQGLPKDLAYRQGLWALTKARKVLSFTYSDSLLLSQMVKEFSIAAVAQEGNRNRLSRLLRWKSLPTLSKRHRKPTLLEDWLQLASQAVLTWDWAVLGGRRYVIS